MRISQSSKPPTASWRRRSRQYCGSTASWLPTTTPSDLVPPASALTTDRLSVCYSGMDWLVVHDVMQRAELGTRVALVGQIGQGKTLSEGRRGSSLGSRRGTSEFTVTQSRRATTGSPLCPNVATSTGRANPCSAVRADRLVCPPRLVLPPRNAQLIDRRLGFGPTRLVCLRRPADRSVIRRSATASVAYPRPGTGV